ncbi:hypothetical protein SD457_11570 [Coprobacillaceae bacterium CR2/5/TPMF4]|nr:hypothetical protein SD457_11570 [Coprobacillaceae bacterium CR2/5/TPMF4]
MDKLLTEIYCLITNKTYDIYIPLNLVFGEIKLLIANLIEYESNSRYFKGNQIILCKYADGSIFPENKTPQDECLKNGDKLMIF